MVEYIEREAVMQKFADHVKRSNNSDFAPVPTWNQAVQIVEDSPAADARPFTRGKWEPVHRYKDNAVVGWGCSVCGFEIDISEDGFNYCPKCGADMRECET